ncbi:LysR family transcriptional regulator [Bradyrhizobium barranii]|uniref:LysR family transcriptional regulator n=1 Tax=Bradyrhizobium barranii TaxID=2992140 RepID=A0ABY3QYW9_9BRAD|nr:LysR family transcriptional regulator [Bradyrhizobium japonicum]UFW91225.1 LysR family transcriptional regulator [Bradyrhizobium japonicum]
MVAQGCGSFRKAAELLSVQHSALSRTVTQLEAQVGVTLFERSATGVRPTLAGLHFLKHATAILEQIKALLEATSGMGLGQTDQLRVGLCASVGAGRLGELLADFRRHCTPTNLVATERSPTGLRRSLQDSGSDIIIVPRRPDSAAVHARALWRERVLVLLPTNHALASHETVCWPDLRDHTTLLATPDRADDVEEMIESKILMHGITQNVQHHDVSRHLIHRLTSLGFGLSFILESDIATFGNNVVYRELHDEQGQVDVCFYAHWLPNNRNRALHTFLSLLTERYPSPADR